MAAQTAAAAGARVERVPPYSEEAERAVLGSALLDAARVIDLCLQGQLSPDAFYIHPHRLLFELLLTLTQEGKPIDVLTVGERLNTDGLLEKVGGTAFLDYLIDSTPTAAHAGYYIDIVRQKHLLRSLIQSARESIEDCYGAQEDASVVLSRAEQAVFQLSSLQQRSFVPWADLITRAMHEIEEIYQTKKGYTGIPTGFKDIDRLLMGLKPSDMIVLAARPSMGKTSLALNIAEHAATEHRDDPSARPVAVFSLEMSSEQLVRRMICCHARVPSHKLSGGYINEVNHGHLTQAASALMRAPIYLDDTAGLSALELRSRARRLKRKYDVELIVVDYLQMMNYPEFAREGRQREVAAISGSIKAMAKELQVPVLVLSQLSRAPETRDRLARPRLSDLRDSGSIEQDADVVCLLRRPCKYPDDPDRDDKTLAILDIAKHRNGATGEIKLHFDEEFTRFEDRAHGVDDSDAGTDPSSGGFEG